MTKETLIEVLARACGTGAKGPHFAFEERQEATLFLSAQGTLLTVDRVREIDLSGGALLARNARSELYLVDPAAVLGLKVRAANEGAGFSPR